MRFAIHISNWTNPYVVHYLWSRGDDNLNTGYISTGPDIRPSALLSIRTKRQKDRYFRQQLHIDRIDLYYTLEILVFFFSIGAIVFLKRLIS